MNPCQCWLNPVVLHDGHCCFDYPTPLDQIKLGDYPPCGHWVGPRPEVTTAVEVPR